MHKSMLPSRAQPTPKALVLLLSQRYKQPQTHLELGR